MFDVALMYRNVPSTNNGNNHPNPCSPVLLLPPSDLSGLSCFVYDSPDWDDEGSDSSGRLCLVDSDIVTLSLSLSLVQFQVSNFEIWKAKANDALLPLEAKLKETLEISTLSFFNLLFCFFFFVFSFFFFFWFLNGLSNWIYSRSRSGVIVRVRFKCKVTSLTLYFGCLKK